MAWICAAAAALGAGLVADAQAYTAHNGAAATPFATGFTANHRGIGPVGVAFDPSGRVYISAQRHVYRFGSRGGRAEAASRLNQRPYGLSVAGLAFGTDGRLYAARYRAFPLLGDVVELDPRDGSVVRTLVDDVPCPVGLAVDPVSGDLFYSTVECERGVKRIRRPASDRPAVSTYLDELFVDGMTFGPDGTLYIAHSTDIGGANVSAVAGTAAPDAGTRRPLSPMPGVDGTALAVPDRAGDPPPFVIINRNNGRITKLDLRSGQRTDLVTGATRGDLIAVGPDGCMYATMSTEVLRVTNADGTCRPGDPVPPGTTPTRNPPLGNGLSPTAVAVRNAVKRCKVGRRLRLRLMLGRLTVRKARVFIGARRVRTVRGRALRRRVLLRHLPAKRFTVVIRVRTRSGKKRVRRITYSACGRQLLRVRWSRR
jgi:hypothetical protein